MFKVGDRVFVCGHAVAAPTGFGRVTDISTKHNQVAVRLLGMETGEYIYFRDQVQSAHVIFNFLFGAGKN